MKVPLRGGRIAAISLAAAVRSGRGLRSVPHRRPRARTPVARRPAPIHPHSTAPMWSRPVANERCGRACRTEYVPLPSINSCLSARLSRSTFCMVIVIHSQDAPFPTSRFRLISHWTILGVVPPGEYQLSYGTEACVRRGAGRLSVRSRSERFVDPALPAAVHRSGESVSDPTRPGVAATWDRRSPCPSWESRGLPQRSTSLGPRPQLEKGRSHLGKATVVAHAQGFVPLCIHRPGLGGISRP